MFVLPIFAQCLAHGKCLISAESIDVSSQLRHLFSGTGDDEDFISFSEEIGSLNGEMRRSTESCLCTLLN